MTDPTALTAKELLPCPFCGGAAYLHEREGQRPDESSFSIHCDGCEATHATGRDEVIQAWNTRTPSPSLEAMREALEAEGYKFPLRVASGGSTIIDATACYVAELSSPHGGAARDKMVKFLVDAANARAALSPQIASAGGGDPAQASWQCMGRKQSLPEPGECNWPDCGCDPYATEVIESLVEQGWTPPDAKTPTMIRCVTCHRMVTKSSDIERLAEFEASSLPSAQRPAPTYCAHCDHEHQLHEDAQGFHHVIRGERVACCSVTSTLRPGGDQ